MLNAGFQIPKSGFWKYYQGSFQMIQREIQPVLWADGIKFCMNGMGNVVGLRGYPSTGMCEGTEGGYYETE